MGDFDITTHPMRWRDKSDILQQYDDVMSRFKASEDRIATLTRERDEARAHVEAVVADVRAFIGNPQIYECSHGVSMNAPCEEAGQACECASIRRILATPATSLAEHDKAVEARVAERCAEIAHHKAMAADHDDYGRGWHAACDSVESDIRREFGVTR